MEDTVDDGVKILHLHAGTVQIILPSNFTTQKPKNRHNGTDPGQKSTHKNDGASSDQNREAEQEYLRTIFGQSSVEHAYTSTRVHSQQGEKEWVPKRQQNGQQLKRQTQRRERVKYVTKLFVNASPQTTLDGTEKLRKSGADNQEIRVPTKIYGHLRDDSDAGPRRKMARGLLGSGHTHDTTNREIEMDETALDIYGQVQQGEKEGLYIRQQHGQELKRQTQGRERVNHVTQFYVNASSQTTLDKHQKLGKSVTEDQERRGPTKIYGHPRSESNGDPPKKLARGLSGSGHTFHNTNRKTEMDETALNIVGRNSHKPSLSPIFGQHAEPTALLSGIKQSKPVTDESDTDENGATDDIVFSSGVSRVYVRYPGTRPQNGVDSMTDFFTQAYEPARSENDTFSNISKDRYQCSAAVSNGVETWREPITGDNPGMIGFSSVVDNTVESREMLFINHSFDFLGEEHHSSENEEQQAIFFFVPDDLEAGSAGELDEPSKHSDAHDITGKPHLAQTSHFLVMAAAAAATAREGEVYPHATLEESSDSGDNTLVGDATVEVTETDIENIGCASVKGSLERKRFVLGHNFTADRLFLGASQQTEDSARRNDISAVDDASDSEFFFSGMTLSKAMWRAVSAGAASLNPPFSQGIMTHQESALGNERPLRSLSSSSSDDYVREKKQRSSTAFSRLRSSTAFSRLRLATKTKRRKDKDNLVDDVFLDEVGRRDTVDVESTKKTKQMYQHDQGLYVQAALALAEPKRKLAVWIQQQQRSRHRGSTTLPSKLMSDVTRTGSADSLQSSEKSTFRKTGFTDRTGISTDQTKPAVKGKDVERSNMGFFKIGTDSDTETSDQPRSIDSDTSTNDKPSHSTLLDTKESLCKRRATPGTISSISSSFSDVDSHHFHDYKRRPLSRSSSNGVLTSESEIGPLVTFPKSWATAWKRKGSHHETTEPEEVGTSSEEQLKPVEDVSAVELRRRFSNEEFVPPSPFAMRARAARSPSNLSAGALPLFLRSQSLSRSGRGRQLSMDIGEEWEIVNSPPPSLSPTSPRCPLGPLSPDDEDDSVFFGTCTQRDHRSSLGGESIVLREIATSIAPQPQVPKKRSHQTSAKLRLLYPNPRPGPAFPEPSAEEKRAILSTLTPTELSRLQRENNPLLLLLRKDDHIGKGDEMEKDDRVGKDDEMRRENGMGKDGEMWKDNGLGKDGEMWKYNGFGKDDGMGEDDEEDEDGDGGPGPKRGRKRKRGILRGGADTLASRKAIEEALGDHRKGAQRGVEHHAEQESTCDGVLGTRLRKPEEEDSVEHERRQGQQQPNPKLDTSIANVFTSSKPVVTVQPMRQEVPPPSEHTLSEEPRTSPGQVAVSKVLHPSEHTLSKEPGTSPGQVAVTMPSHLDDLRRLEDIPAWKRRQMSNPFNRLNQRCHSTLQCPCCFFFCFLCCLPAVIFMGRSDREFDHGSVHKARRYGRRTTIMYFVGAVVALILLAASATATTIYLYEYLTARNRGYQ